MGSGGGSKSTSSSYGGPTAWQKKYGQEYILPFFQNQGAPSQQSQYYPQISGMYQGLLQQGTPGLAPEVSKTISDMVTTGSPYDQTKMYEAAYPAYQRDLNKAIAQANETAGIQGGVGSSMGETYLGKAAGETTLDFNKFLAELSRQSYEAAQARKMGAIPYGFQEQQLPYQTLQQLLGLGAGVEKSQYPWLDEAMQFFQGGPNVSFSDSNAVQQQGGILSSCGCRIFTEDWTKELETSVRKFRDTHFPPCSFVSKGYKMMSNIIVPLMRKNKFFRQMIRTIMLKPMTNISHHWEGKNRFGWLFIPLGAFWTTSWDMIGRVKYLSNSWERKNIFDFGEEGYLNCNGWSWIGKYNLKGG